MTSKKRVGIGYTFSSSCSLRVFASTFPPWLRFEQALALVTTLARHSSLVTRHVARGSLALQERLKRRPNLAEDVVNRGGDEAAVDIEQDDRVDDRILAGRGA